MDAIIFLVNLSST